MKIKNTGAKIINIGAKILMPDGSMEINEATFKLPAIQAFVSMGLLTVDDGDAKFQQAVEEAAAKKLAEEKEKAEAEAKAKAEVEAAAKAAEDKKKAEEAAAKKAAAEAAKKAAAESK